MATKKAESGKKTAAKKAVKKGNQEEARKQRTNICNQRAMIRYWLSHKAEA